MIGLSRAEVQQSFDVWLDERGLGGLIQPDQILIRLDGQDIAALVLRMPGMPPDPVKLNRVFASQFVQKSPEVFVLHGFPGCRLPTAFFPGGKPLVKPFEDILRIAGQFDDGRLGEFSESFDHRDQFHPVIGRFALGPGSLDLFAAGGMSQDEPPASGPGVARAGTISKEENAWTHDRTIPGLGSEHDESPPL